MHWSCRRRNDSNGLLFLLLCVLEKYLQFRKKQKHLSREIFGSFQITGINRIFLLRNCVSNYVYLKNMYITLKGIGKTLFVSVLRIFLICKFLNFTTAFTTKKLNFPEFAYNFPCDKVNFNVIQSIHITIRSF